MNINLRVSNRSIVRGCPGVPRSIPRLDTVVELRSPGTKPFQVRSVSVELRTTQKVSVPSKLGAAAKIAANIASRDYVIYSNPYAYRPPHNEFHQTLLGLDVPVVIPLPRGIIPSGQFLSWDASTVHRLYVSVSCGPSVDREVTFVESFPVAIKVYDTLPLYRQFNEPVVETRTSPNQQVVVETTVPVSSVGPRDPFRVGVKVSTNPQHNRVKKNMRLDRLTLQIKEVLETHEGGLPPLRENKIFTKSVAYDGCKLTSQGLSHEFMLDFPFENDYLQMYENNPTDSVGNVADTSDVSIQQVNISRNRFVDELDEGIPPTHSQGFTSPGRLFSIRYDAVVKIKMSHAKDLEFRLPFTVSPYNRPSSEYLLPWIVGECEGARDRFGRDMVNRIAEARYEDVVGVMARFTPPPIVYRDNRGDRERLGYGDIID